MEDAFHRNCDSVVVRVDRFWVMRPPGWVERLSGGQEGLIALFRSTSSAVIALSPVAATVCTKNEFGELSRVAKEGMEGLRLR